MEKRKVILLSVAGVCILAAGVALTLQLTDNGPAATPQPTLEEVLQQDPAVKKGYEDQLEFQEKELKAGRQPAGG